MFVGVTVVVAPTDAEAQDKLDEYRDTPARKGALAHYSASIGVDFSRYGPDEPIRSSTPTRAIQSRRSPRSGGTWTRRKLIG